MEAFAEHFKVCMTDDVACFVVHQRSIGFADSQ